MQTAEQILAVTNDNLKRSEEDFGTAKTELSATNRQLKEAQRQLETLQIQLSKSMSFLPTVLPIFTYVLTDFTNV